jgi:antitoxin FitA
VSAIQIKNVPSDVHEQLRSRARREGRNLGDYVLGVLERELATPSTREWLDSLREDEPVHDIAPRDVVELIEAGRAERDEQILRAVSTRD